MENNKVPELRFPEFEGEFIDKYKFNDIFNFSTGKNIKQKEASPEFDIPCVRYGELYHMYNEVIYEVINKTNLYANDLKFSEGNEILLPSAGEDPLDIGSASALTHPKIAIGRTINILKPKSENIYSQIFVSYYINQKLKKKIASLAKGVSISNVYNSDLKTLSASLPSLPEQTKIATFLTAIDQRIHLLEKKKTDLEQYKKGVMQGLFRRPLSKTGSLRSNDKQDIDVDKNLEHLDISPIVIRQFRFKKDDGTDFPDWEEKKLGEVADIYQPKTISQNQLTDNGFDVYGANGIIGKFSEYNHEKEQVVVTCRGNTCGTVNWTRPYSWITGNAMVINLDDNKKVIKLFVFYFLSFTNLDYLITGSGQPQITGDIKKHRLQLPSKKEQQKIASFLSAIDKKIEIVAEQIEASKVFKKGLLQKMFV